MKLATTLSTDATVLDQIGMITAEHVTVIAWPDGTISIGGALHHQDDITQTDIGIDSIHGWSVIF